MSLISSKTLNCLGDDRNVYRKNLPILTEVKILVKVCFETTFKGNS